MHTVLSVSFPIMKMKPDKSELLARIRTLQKELDSLMDMVIAMEEIEPVQEHHEINDDWMSVKQVCEHLNISQTTFYEAVKNGFLPKGFAFGARTKRWRLSDIKAWQAKQNNHDSDVGCHNTHKRRGRVSRVRKINEFII